MAQAHIAFLLDDAQLTLDEIAVSCTVSRDWIIEHVAAGVLFGEPGSAPERWTFSGSDLLRARRISKLERDFDANPELAGLVVDLLDEIERMRIRLRRSGLPTD